MISDGPIGYNRHIENYKISTHFLSSKEIVVVFILYHTIDHWWNQRMRTHWVAPKALSNFYQTFAP